MNQKTLRNMKLVDKVNFVKRLVVDVLGIENEERILRMLCRLANQTGSVRLYGGNFRTRDEQVLAEILRTNNMSSKTAYTWFLLVRSPKYLLERYNKGELSQNQLKLMKERQNVAPPNKAISNQILTEVRRLVGGL